MLKNVIHPGCVLIHTLFLITVNDIYKLPIKLSSIQFADETSIHKSSTHFCYVHNCILSDQSILVYSKWYSDIFASKLLCRNHIENVKHICNEKS